MGKHKILHTTKAAPRPVEDFEIEATRLLRSVKEKSPSDDNFMNNAYFEIQSGITYSQSVKIGRLLYKYLRYLPSTALDILYKINEKNICKKEVKELRVKSEEDLYFMIMLRNHYVPNGKITVEDVRRVHKYVCEYYDVDYELSLTRSRKLCYRQVRQVTCGLMEGKASLKLIAKAVNFTGLNGIPDHSTVIHSLKRLKSSLQTDKQLLEDYFTIKNRVGL